ncbi:MAG: hypothetical protein M0C28_41205 [Candidatus Moduliflexus flocculans]|nr:hypothetical protein [Candidatus Moduliflexus flocculans]
MRRALIVPVLLGLVLVGLPAARAQDPQRFSLSMFHFNVQYVPGGTTGFLGDDPNPAFALDDEQVQDIITESFEPVLDLFLAHPDWKVTLEMQGLMVEAAGPATRACCGSSSSSTTSARPRLSASTTPTSSSWPTRRGISVSRR